MKPSLIGGLILHCLFLGVGLALGKVDFLLLPGRQLAGHWSPFVLKLEILPRCAWFENFIFQILDI